MQVEQHILKSKLIYELPVHQGILENVLSKLFPTSKVIKEARKEISIRNPDTGDYLEVDVWYPELNLCFEYQDGYHYFPTWKSQLPLSTIQEKDSAKRDLLLRKGETLIIVPCWWDGSSESLQATINFHRPDLCSEKSKDIIPANPPSTFFPATHVPENMKLMLASFPSGNELIEINEENPWWLGEKYDGVRCYWNPEEKQLYTRHGLQITLPPSFSLLFGRVVLDGEIWCGRGNFAETNILAQSNFEKINWSLFRVVCFDEASKQMSKKIFEKRYYLVLSHFDSEHPLIVIASRFLCKSPQVLARSLQKLVEGGGEGIILRKPRSLFHPGRSDFLLKIKASKEDQEALVMNVEENGSLLLQLPSGGTFIVPKEDCLLHRSPKRGDIVTFTHEDLARRKNAETQDTAHESQGSTHELALRARAGTQDVARPVLSKPLVFRIRYDLSWEYVLAQSQKDANQLQENKAKKKRHASYEREKVMRNNLETLARSFGFDPLLAENWYNVSRQQLLLQKEIRPIISHYGSSLVRALIELFPELNLEVSKFSATPHKFWDNVNNRRELFKKFAKEKGGDPLDARFWLSVKPKMLFKFKGMKGVMVHYKGLHDAVMHLFPELKLTRTAKLWTPQDRKSFFDKFAESKGFDPLVPDNWYSVSFLDLSKHQGFKKIIKYYEGDLSECLTQIYPNIGLQKSKFGIDIPKQREIFEKFAEAKGSSPLSPSFWYSLNPLELRKFKSVREVVKCYGGYPESVLRLFPELHLKRIKFVQYIKQSWTDEKDRKKFFDNFAKSEGFDPLVAVKWYRVDVNTLRKIPGANRILYHYYGGKLSSCLMQLYPNIGLQKSRFKKKPNVNRSEM